ncbi:MAG: pyruvate, phosphate dikinase [Chloroflexi bacterium]|nr:pyruvate, phosphate dikinase [Chloroflexota bacterium]
MTTTATTWVYLFHDGDGTWRNLLGGKGAGLAEMTKADLPVPPGFTITTEACIAYYAAERQFPPGMWDQVRVALASVEQALGRTLGDPSNPLLVSVRSGARFSMPGMMDTVLNLGLSDATAAGLAMQTGNPRFVYDSYRRFIQMFGKVVLEVNAEHYEHAIAAMKQARGVALDTDLTTDDLKQLVEEFKAITRREVGRDFPNDAHEQLRMSIEAVFQSWNNRRAIDYRNLNKIAHDLGTAVNVQAMVFGNMGDTSATGVAFTRNPSTGEPGLFGEYLVNAQGEDVVAGIRTPKHIGDMRDDPNLPGVYHQFVAVAEQLERHYKDMQDLEFTVQEGRLFMLQTRTGKRTGPAAVRAAVDMANEGLIDRTTAVQRVEPAQLDQLLHPMIDPNETVTVLATGLPASPGAAVGQVVFDADEAQELGQAGDKVILVRVETSPEDFHGMVEAQAILTARGGMTSHAAVVARGMGKPCVVGCGALAIDYGRQQFSVDGTVVRKGDYITIDGGTGRVIVGQARTVEPELSGYMGTLMEWADEFRQLGVRTNADTPHDAEVARGFGAEGIGLCRTEHMFFEGHRIDAMREMILADDLADRQAALAKLLPYQREDFAGIFRAMDGLPVTIRTLDPPLHEFLPHDDETAADLATKLNVPVEKIKARVDALHEFNPMLGFRGCRLGIQYPEITEMQARAIFQAAVQVQREGKTVLPEIMIPLVGDVSELTQQRAIVDRVAAEEMAAAGVTINYLVGTMIELPRAALLADEIAQQAQFFSYGTNDLTQTAFGMSRDDAGRFLPMYVEQKLLADDPFQVLDRKGVGKLMRIGAELGRTTRPDLKVGICGEHGGEPSSVMFCHQIGLNYVSASPYRVPIARLAAAQAAIGDIVRDR